MSDETGGRSETGDDSGGGGEPSRAQRMRESLHERREQYQDRSLPYKAAWVGTGLIVTLGGIAMLALPGPAFVVIPIGLAMLALQFTWAERALDQALDRAEQAQRKAQAASRTQKLLGALAVACGIAAFVAAAILYDIPVLPV